MTIPTAYQTAQGLLVACLLGLVLASVLNPKGNWHESDFQSTNVLSRLAPVERFLATGSLALDGSPWPPTTDKVMIGGRFYSSKPPLPTLLYLGPSALLGALGYPMASNRALHASVLILLLHFLPYLAAASLALKTLSSGSVSPAGLILTALAFGMATLPPLYSTDVSNHVPAAAALLGAFLIVRRQATDPKALLAAGFLGGLASACEHTALGFQAAFLICVLLQENGRKSAAWMLAGGLIPTLFTLGYYQSLSGLPIPLYLQHRLYDYPGSIWNVVGPGIDIVPHASPTAYVTSILIGPQGLFLLSPILLFATFELLRTAFAFSRHPDGATRLAWSCLLPMLVTLTFIIFFTYGADAGTHGIRWFIHLTPVLVCYLPNGFTTLRNAWPRIAHALTALALIIGLLSYTVVLTRGSAWTRCQHDDRGQPTACI